MKKRKIIMQRKLSKDYKILGVGTFFLLIIVLLIIAPYFQEQTLINNQNKVLSLKQMLDDLALSITITTIELIVVDLCCEIIDLSDNACIMGAVSAFLWIIPHDPSKWDLSIAHVMLKLPLTLVAMGIMYLIIAALTTAVKVKLKRW